MAMQRETERDVEVATTHDGRGQEHNSESDEAQEPTKTTSLTPPAAQIDEKQAIQLGRQRPEVFQNIWVEMGFCASILFSTIMAEFLISGFNVLLPNLMADLDFESSEKTWPSSVFSLVAGAFLLPFGRICDMYGGYPIFLAGNAWMCLWALIAGFSHSFEMLIVCRALQGLGAAAFLPAGIGILGSVYRPGRRKNLIFSLYGGSAPFGFFFGILIAGMGGEIMDWPWFFHIGAILMGCICLLIFLTVPRDVHKSPRMQMDWWGSVTSIAGLMLLIYAITDSPHVKGGWSSPQIIVTFIAGVCFLGAFIYVEGWVATSPLLPLNLFRTKGVSALFLCMFMAFGSFGIFLLYASFYLETILHIPPLLTAAWFAPLAAGGLVIAFVGGIVLHRLPGTVLLLISCAGFVIALLLFAVSPMEPNYWQWIFPSMVCATIGIDVMYNVANIFITTRVRGDQQGAAGACINGLLFIGMSFWLGWVEFTAGEHYDGTEQSLLEVPLYMGVGCGVVAFLIVAALIRVPKAEGELTVDEKEQLPQEGTIKDGNVLSQPPTTG